MAVQNDFYIIEDDYDSEFRYSGSPISPVYAMCPARVAYVGSFSKTLFPALRLGFAVLPKPLQEAWRHYRTYMDVQNPVLEQAALAEFLRSRKMDRHVQKMRRAYGEKRGLLLAALQTKFGTEALPWGDASGLHLALQFPGACFGPKFTAACRTAGVRVATVAQYCPAPTEHRDKLLLGYGHLTPDQITNGVAALHRVITEGADVFTDNTLSVPQKAPMPQ
ncbi:HTH-type transcriptional regulatory protein GabR [bioreactor metagenome]|uniref:HTH-type transcriptional regulatory protein GabR n=1 Tax=bioreactor metagenome TaxID=1076179 RepID=A0A645A7N7_9ZZZZ